MEVGVSADACQLGRANEWQMKVKNYYDVAGENQNFFRCSGRKRKMEPIHCLSFVDRRKTKNFTKTGIFGRFLVRSTGSEKWKNGNVFMPS